jgi:KamA family protein
MWKNELKNNICSVDQIKEYTKISPEEEKKLQEVINKHPMSITSYYASLIDWDNPADPLKRMAVPSVEELNLSGEYDASYELANTKMPGLQHKYSQTALILITNRCASYCRYCFRKRMVSLKTNEVLKRIEDAVSYIQEHKEITNVLISGGDPFILETSVIETILEKLSCVNHINFIRFGTKVPVTFPTRILEDEKLLTLLKKYSSGKRIYVVTHFNHPKEITESSINAISNLINSQIIVSNQTVLLKNINDNPETMAELQEGLVKIGVIPYYVFQCRPVKRVKHHFQTTLYEGYNIIEEAKKKLNGLSKGFRYVMSNKTGKIEIVGISTKNIYFKYHQSKNPLNCGKFFSRKLNKKMKWLDMDFE